MLPAFCPQEQITICVFGGDEREMGSWAEVLLPVS